MNWHVSFELRDLPGARILERSLEIDALVHGTEEHPSVAASLHALAGVLQAQGIYQERVHTWSVRWR